MDEKLKKLAIENCMTRSELYDQAYADALSSLPRITQGDLAMFLHRDLHGVDGYDEDEDAANYAYATELAGRLIAKGVVNVKEPHGN